MYDVTKYLDSHPGGSEVMMEVMGKYADDMFEDIGHSSEARKVMAQFLKASAAAVRARAARLRAPRTRLTLPRTATGPSATPFGALAQGPLKATDEELEKLGVGGKSGGDGGGGMMVPIIVVILAVVAYFVYQQQQKA